jgi:alkyl sulfatase BDS1-like metallo-beta-lactamase superfamily hydrolase
VYNLVTPDNGEKFVVELSNNTLTNIQGQQAADADMTITVDRSDLESVMMGVATFDDLVGQGKATMEGNRKAFDDLRAMLVQFSMGFQILPGTGGTSLTAAPAKPFEQPAPAINAITD